VTLPDDCPTTKSEEVNEELSAAAADELDDFGRKRTMALPIPIAHVWDVYDDLARLVCQPCHLRIITEDDLSCLVSADFPLESMNLTTNKISLDSEPCCGEKLIDGTSTRISPAYLSPSAFAMRRVFLAQEIVAYGL
jgi:hypothetical protein